MIDASGASSGSWFVASFVPGAAARRLARLGRGLPPQVAPLGAEVLHLTWRSFDDLPPGTLGDVEAALEAIALEHPPLILELMGGGVFAGGSVWARVCPKPPVLALQTAIDRALGALGLPGASHPFVPHITLARGPAGTRLPFFLHDLSTRVQINALALTTVQAEPTRVVASYPLRG